MSDIHALVGAYAVDALDDEERTAFESHLAACETCRAELDDLRETASLLAVTQATAPPAGLRDRLLADVDRVRPLPPEVGQGSHARQLRSRPALMVAAAAAVIALGAGAVVWQQPWADDTSQTQRLTAAERVRAADDAQVHTWTVRDGVEATLVRSASLNQAVLVTEGMPRPPDGKVYELWLEQDEGLVPAGLMTGAEDEVVLEGDPATAVGFGITVEPAGGSEQPTSEPLTLIRLEDA